MKNKAVSFPVLSVEALEAADSREAALTLPFPTKPTSDLLRKTADELRAYLKCVIYDATSSDNPEWVRGEVRRICNRLIKIADAFPTMGREELDAHTREQLENADREYWGDHYAGYKRYLESRKAN